MESQRINLMKESIIRVFAEQLLQLEADVEEDEAICFAAKK